jgi:tetraacyldisaccharide 4'-kinase
VISVGNLTVGGTGKTEMVVALARQLHTSGFRPCVLTRGYKRRSRIPSLAVSAPDKILLDPETAGDEPWLIAARLPGVPVWVDADRWRGACSAQKAFGCNVFVLDDGFQQRFRMQRDLDILLVDATDPWGGDVLLPAGRLREPLAALAESQVIVITRAARAGLQSILTRLKSLAPKSAIFCGQHEPLAMLEHGQPLSFGLDTLHGREVRMLAGIAKPQAFRTTLEEQGAKVIDARIFPDHHWYSKLEIERLARWAKGPAPVITTQKDYVRLQSLWPAESRLWILEIAMHIVDQQLAEAPDFFHKIMHLAGLRQN